MSWDSFQICIVRIVRNLTLIESKHWSYLFHLKALFMLTITLNGLTCLLLEVLWKLHGTATAVTEFQVALCKKRATVRSRCFLSDFFADGAEDSCLHVGVRRGSINMYKIPLEHLLYLLLRLQWYRHRCRPLSRETKKGGRHSGGHSPMPLPGIEVTIEPWHTTKRMQLAATGCA
jgi:hypothetical protein